MKKIIASILTICLVVFFMACGNQNTDGTAAGNEETVENQEPEETQEVTSEVEAVEETTDTPEATEETPDNTNTEAGETTGATTTLVVYFSATGNTKNVAENIASGLGADTYEIIAAEPYSEADLDYGDDSSRSTQEMNDSSARPAISGSVENMDQYDTIYIGYPIWWGEAPRIVDTFVESYDFTDKTIIPFCTSISTGMGSSAETLESLAGAGTWLEGTRFSGSESATEIMDWVNSL